MTDRYVPKYVKLGGELFEVHPPFSVYWRRSNGELRRVRDPVLLTEVLAVLRARQNLSRDDVSSLKDLQEG